MTYFGSGIWLYSRTTCGAIFLVTVPATIIKSAWRGEGRNTSAPNRARSHLAIDAAIISMAQHARPKPSGQMEFLRPQLYSSSRVVVNTPCLLNSLRSPSSIGEWGGGVMEYWSDGASFPALFQYSNIPTPLLFS